MLLTSTPTDQATMVVAGVDTHRSTHHAAVLDRQGRLRGEQQFPVTAAGYQALLAWVESHGTIDRIGVELTGSYGAGLTRYLIGAGVSVVEVNSTDRATRARRGKTDLLDSIAAAQKVLAGMATATPKDTTGTVETIRILTMVRDSAVRTRTQALNQLKDLRITAPATLRETLDGLPLPQLARTAATFTPDTATTPTERATMTAMTRLATRIMNLDHEIRDADHDLEPLVAATAPTLVAAAGIGTHTAARLLICAGGNPDRVGSSAAFTRLCGAAPIPASSGKTNRMRLHRGGDRQANRALHMIVIGRMKNHTPTKTFVDRKLAEGKSKRDAIRALKKYVAREVFTALKNDHNLT
ncbi:IS110 family transposase [Lacisediminihabitans changchengi]|uniref:IS110 family transposase n=1 Tax=Lacisediminihabitans changchengi TaxID=2787634 RepID=A0A934SMR1_9MICO|nr:IS110 family transposase [Lacisediminihabitans changchengi]MBK4348189.1 IS110 family transposase [Lacisediminihabitans changchengi]